LPNSSIRTFLPSYNNGELVLSMKSTGVQSVFRRDLNSQQLGRWVKEIEFYKTQANNFECSKWKTEELMPVNIG
ncbi:MAG TPA: hypothetical protein PKK48_00095, partial [Phycisphaerae bacterium]|nr:hypothetical protein [Phycisphaerae bacterium]